MPILAPESVASFNEVPDRVPPIETGTYLLEVTKVEVKENKKKTGNNLVLTSTVQAGANGMDTPMKGRMLTEYLSLPNGSDDQSGKQSKEIRIGQVFKASGVAPELTGGYDTDKLLKSQFKADVGKRLYKDDAGVDQESSEITRRINPKTGSGF